MHIPLVQSVLAAGLALTGSELLKKPAVISEGKILDFAVEKCVDADGEQRCTAPFLVVKDTCYNIEWSTEGTSPPSLYCALVVADKHIFAEMIY